MTPQTKKKMSTGMENIYRSILLIMVSICTFFAKKTYDRIDMLAIHDNENAKDHVEFRIEIAQLKSSDHELKGRIDGLKDNFNWNREALSKLQNHE
jgi:hypothetical protein